MKLLITGGAGFVGSNLAIKIKQENPLFEIVVLDNLKRRGSELNLKRLNQNKIQFFHGDIRNKEDFENIGKFDLMIECSAEPSVLAGTDSTPAYLINTNLMGTINCLEEARRNNAKIIFLSTSRVYPTDKINSMDFIEEEDRFSIQNHFKKGISENFSLDGPRSLYGATKLCSEILIQEYISNYNLKGIINRCGVIAGPWQMGKVDQGVIVLWVAKHIFNGRLSYIGFGGEGKQVRDFIHIDDLSDIINIQIKDFEKFNNQIFNIGGGIENSISRKEVTRVCQKVTSNQIEISSIPETRKSDLKWFITDSTKIKNLTGWNPKKDIYKTVGEISDWINSNKDSLRFIFA
jgi:CDP-paratose 2-epimerase